MKRILIVSHSADFDGILAGEACKYGHQKRHPDDYIEIRGWDFGNPRISTVGFDLTYVLDLPPTALDEESMSNTYSIIWIDHHKSAIQEFDDQYPFGLRMDGVAACRLVWQYFFNEYEETISKEAFVNRAVKEPLLIRLAGEYDVFDHHDPLAVPLQYGLTVAKNNKQYWDSFLLSNFSGEVDELYEAAESGLSIKRYIAAQNEELLAKFGHDVKFAGLNFLCINNWKFNSQTFESGLKPQHDAMLGWRYNGANKTCTVSLYGRKDRQDIDLSVIATRLGGGGHKHACGFTCDFAKMQQILDGTLEVVNVI